jgi:hypothetical protein
MLASASMVLYVTPPFWVISGGECFGMDERDCSQNKLMKSRRKALGSLLAVLSESLKMPQELEWGYGIYHEHCSPQRAFEEIENRHWDTSEWRERLLRDHDKEHMARRRQILGRDMGDSVVNGDHEVRA